MKRGVIIHLVLILGLLYTTEANAFSVLTPTEPSKLSPTASSWNTYAETPVNLFTGAISVNIPLLQVNAGMRHSLPISLSYIGGGGIKAEQPGGIVGTGWMLNAGGVITRTIHDLPDESNSKNKKKEGWYFRHQIADISFDNTILLRSTISRLANDGETMHLDSEPDTFTFSFLDYTGSFFLGEDGEWKLKCNRDVKIEFGGNENDFIDPYAKMGFLNSGINGILDLWNVGYSKSFGKFTIIDEDGNRYMFGSSIEAIDFSIPFFTNSNDRLQADAWHLTRISYIDGRVINFEYDKKCTYTSHIYKYSHAKKIEEKINGIFEDRYNDYKYKSINHYSGTLILPSYLSKIRTQEDSVVISYETDNSEDYPFESICYAIREDWENGQYLPLLCHEWLKDHSIQHSYLEVLGALKRNRIKNISRYCGSQKTSDYTFNYNDTSRLALTSLHEAYSGEIYKFEYHNFDLLPSIFSCGDTFGYNSGYPNISNELCTAGMLSKITYPLGGYTRYEYECHAYSFSASALRNTTTVENQNQKIGGARISCIFESPNGDTSAEYLVKKYFYIQNYLEHMRSGAFPTSSGCLVAYAVNGYTYYVTDSKNNYIRINYESFDRPIKGYDDTNTHIGYSEVTELNADSTFVVHKFTNFDTNPDERPVVDMQSPQGFKPCSVRSQERGLPLKDSYFLSTGKPWKERSYIYESTKPLNDTYVKCIHINPYSVCDNIEFCEGIAYKRYYHTMRLNKLTETEYDDENNSFTITTNISYVPNKKGIKRSVYTAYGNKEDRVTYTYAFEGDNTTNRIMREINLLSAVSQEKHHSNTYNDGIYTRKYGYRPNLIYPDSMIFSGFGGKPRLIERFKYDTRDEVVRKESTGTQAENYAWSQSSLRPLCVYSGEYSDSIQKLLSHKSEFDTTITKSHLKGRQFKAIDYNDIGLPSRLTSDAGSIIEYKYDSSGRLIQESDDGIVLKTYQYHLRSDSTHTVTAGELIGDSDCNFMQTAITGIDEPYYTRHYFDGLGRNTQIVKVGFDGGAYDCLTKNNYTSMGRLSSTIEELPVQYNEGKFVTDDRIAESSERYGADKSYLTKDFYYSGRTGQDPVKIVLPGLAWHTSHGKTIKKSLVMHPSKYCIIRRIEGLMVDTTAYAPGELTMTEMIDEDGHRACEIRDRHNLVVRTIAYDNGQPIMTDFVYDEKDNIRYIFPPMAVNRIMNLSHKSRINDSEILDQCYTYTYDSNNNIRTQKQPHCDVETFYYDTDNLLRLSQKAAQVSDNLWTIHAYDTSYRPIYEAVVKDTTTPSSFIQSLITLEVPFPKCDFDSIDISNFWGYKSIMDIEKKDVVGVKFYDGITPGHFLPQIADSLAFHPFGDALMYPADIKNVITGQLTAVPDDSTYIAKAIYYDSHGRIIQEVSSNILGGFDRRSTIYSHNGLPLKVIETHSTDREYHCDTYRYHYISWDRLSTLSFSHDGSTEIVLLRNYYDEAGRLFSQKIGDRFTTQNSYTLHGNLKSSENPYFSQRLYYEDSDSELKGCLNGNISVYKWASKSDGKSDLWRRYTYTYDDANRLTQAVYGESGSRPSTAKADSADYSEYRSYDLNGNLTSLKAFGLNDRQRLAGGRHRLSFATIKDIAFENSGSQMLSATIAPVSSTVSTMDKSVIGALDRSTTFTFNYDAAGRIVNDGLRKQSWLYDRLGHPSYALPQSGNKRDHLARYTYDAEGRLLRRSLMQTTIDADIEIPDLRFPDSLRDEFPVIDQGQIVSPAEGRLRAVVIRPPGGNLDDFTTAIDLPHTSREYCGNYEYTSHRLARINTPVGYYENGHHFFYIKDYLGNVRGIVNDADSLVCSVHYYPGGSLFGESHGWWNDANLFQGGRLERAGSHTFYDLQARHYDPILCRFLTPDPFSSKYPSTSFYTYCIGNPITAIDPNGKVVVFINGQHAGDGGSSDYWENIDTKIMNALGDNKAVYYDGALEGWANTLSNIFNPKMGNLNAEHRIIAGYQKGISEADALFSSLKDGETIKFITHSMGSAFCKGFVLGFLQYGHQNNIDLSILIEFEVDLAPFQPTKQDKCKNIPTYVINHKYDRIAGVQSIPNATNETTHKEIPLNLVNIWTIWFTEHSITSFEDDVKKIKDFRNNYWNSFNFPKAL